MISPMSVDFPEPFLPHTTVTVLCIFRLLSYDFTHGVLHGLSYSLAFAFTFCRLNLWNNAAMLFAEKIDEKTDL